MSIAAGDSQNLA